MKRNIVLAGAVLAVLWPRAGWAQQVGDVFVIALENHNLTQPSSYTGQQPIEGNPAAPYLNSLITPGNANAANVSYAINYTNSGTGVHPSEPNYIWAEAGTNYNPATNTTVTADNDPSSGSGNLFSTTPHLTGLMDAAGVAWKTYQEDYQISGHGPTVSAGGTLPGGAVNPYNGTTQYSYAVKHDPMAFFPATATENVAPISQLATDLSSNTVGRYNWITPDQYNDMHTALSGGFTYKGTHYTGDQAGIAQGDNFLSMLVPQIQASAAYKNNGAIIIWTDETEGGDTSASTLTEIVISPLARGNAYASSVPTSHSSDVKTMQEIFGLGTGYLNNSIPANEYSPAGGAGTYNTVSGSNDLSDLFKTGAIPSGINSFINNSSGTTTYAADVGANGAQVTVNAIGGKVIFTSSQHLAALNISAGAVVQLTHLGNGPRSVIVTPRLNLTGLLDVSGDALDIQSGDLNSVTALIGQGRNSAGGGAWNGSNGITSSTAAVDTTHLSAVGVIQNNQSGSALYTSINPFLGITPGTNDVLARYTYYGDTNLDGKVDGTDYSRIDNGYLAHLTGWYNGDFNYDGVIDGSDYTLIDNAFNTQGAQLMAAVATQQIASGSSVPEPNMAIMLGATAIGLLRRRRVGNSQFRPSVNRAPRRN